MPQKPERIALLHAQLRSLENDLPDDLRSVLGAFSWAERLHAAEAKGEAGLKLSFWSDGLGLKQKADVETLLKKQAAAAGVAGADLTVYFERREKAPAATPSPAALAGTAAHSHPHQHHGHAAHTHAGTQPSQVQKGNAAPLPGGRKAIPGVKRILAVASGKGGVGKSTVSVNLALALANQGYRIGILDADIYGPSLPMMLGVKDDPQVNAQNKIIPPERFGLKVMSFGFFAPESSAVIWRGPMVMKALQQFFYDVDWGELDFLVIDLPPGTGDAQLTLVQSLPLAGAVIVTTPQNVALLDAVKGVLMFQKTEVPIIGVIENMATFHCSRCGHEEHIFGEGGADKVSAQFSVPVLGHVPLNPALRVAGDSGQPLTAVSGHPVRTHFSEIAEKVVARVMELERASI